jgi:hypothetical protein
MRLDGLTHLCADYLKEIEDKEDTTIDYDTITNKFVDELEDEKIAHFLSHQNIVIQLYYGDLVMQDLTGSQDGQKKVKAILKYQIRSRLNEVVPLKNNDFSNFFIITLDQKLKEIQYELQSIINTQNIASYKEFKDSYSILIHRLYKSLKAEFNINHKKDRFIFARLKKSIKDTIYTVQRNLDNIR